jgi:hypothetical protein
VRAGAVYADQLFCAGVVADTFGAARPGKEPAAWFPGRWENRSTYL